MGFTDMDAKRDMSSEVELMQPMTNLGYGSGRFSTSAGGEGSVEEAGAPPSEAVRRISLTRLILVCMVAGGVQFGWALQLSLLTPYIQSLGISHALSSLMWLCGPITGFIVQPFVGLWSDSYYSRFGRRRPFILVGCLLICISVLVVGFSADIGYALGDTKEHCSVYQGQRLKAAIICVIGFWLLDLSNNTVQCPARALIADLSGQHGYNTANAIFSSWLAFGNILGYASGASRDWHRWFPFLQSRACCEACANLKGAFLVAVVFLLFCMLVTLIVAKEIPLLNKHSSVANASEKSSTDQTKDTPTAGLMDIFRTFRSLPQGMPSVLIVTSLTWLSWFPFFLYNTDWVGREVYHGDPKGNASQTDAYNTGVRIGALGLLLNSVVLGATSFVIGPMCRKLSVKMVWVVSNLALCISMAAMSIISVWSYNESHGGSHQVAVLDDRVKVAALVLFAALGFPLAILYSVPGAVTAQLASNAGSGQGMCIGVLNISIVIPQVIIALSAGPWDSLFGDGNMPAFALASATAFVAAIVGLFILPKLSRSNFNSVGFSGGGH